MIYWIMPLALRQAISNWFCLEIIVGIRLTLWSACILRQNLLRVPLVGFKIPASLQAMIVESRCQRALANHAQKNPYLLTLANPHARIKLGTRRLGFFVTSSEWNVKIRLSDWSICITWPQYSILIGSRYTVAILLLESQIRAELSFFCNFA